MIDLAFTRTLGVTVRAPTARRGGGSLIAWSVVILLASLSLHPISAETAGGRTAEGMSGSRARSPVELRDRPVLGQDTAPVVVLEVSSFKCAHCRAFHEKVFPRLLEEYVDSGKAQWVVLNASDDPSEQFTPLFSIARCALRQGRYWEVLDSLFRYAGRPPSFLESMFAKNPQIDAGQLEICLRDRTIRSAISGDFGHYARLKLKGTPSFLVWKLGKNGERTEAVIAGAQTLEYFRRVFDEMLKAP